MQHVIAALTPERTYVLPHPALRGVISHYTLFRSRHCESIVPVAEQLQIIPDASGCIVCAITDAQIDLRYWGPTSRAVCVDNGSAIPPLMLFIEFLPGGAKRLLRMPMQPWRDRVEQLDCVDAGLALLIADAFCRCCGEVRSPDHGTFLHCLNHIFLSRFSAAREALLIDGVVSAIFASRGMARVNELARETGYSARHLNRLVSDATGLNVKLLSRIVRINSACHAHIMNIPNLSLTALAQRLGYHDQAHFIHDFQAVCGVTPGKYRDLMSVFYNEELKLSGTIPNR